MNPHARLRLCFVHSADRTYSENQMFGVHFLPVWAYTLAANLDFPHIEFDLADDRMDDLERTAEADLFLYSGMNQDLRAILANRELLARKYPRAKHLIGGPICGSFQAAGKLESLAAFDHIFIGDGEASLREFVGSVMRGETREKIIIPRERFNLAEAKPMLKSFLEKTVDRYYGAVVEVSRGCPFLCEFCDIRTLPDNNRSHTKPVPVILEEVECFARKGKSQIILACDNLIGNTKWAEDLCDALIAWRERTGLTPSFYTWLSIDISRHDRLMRKLKRAGVDMLFIGVESFHKNSLLETSKLQNSSVSLPAEIRKIQSHGLIVVAGLIFGFDTDPDDVVDVTLRGIVESGLISGDPSLLTALPGTPLYLRMKLSKRLRDGKIGLGGFKYQTNIKYLKPVARIVADFEDFVREFNGGSFQYRRLESFYSCLSGPGDAPPAEKRASKGFANLSAAFVLVRRNKKSFFSFCLRFLMLFGSPSRLFFIVRAALLTKRLSRGGRPLWFYYKFWLFNWSNSILKYSRLSAKDFDIGSVPADFQWRDLLPDTYEQDFFEPIPQHKIKMQRKSTADSLRRLISERSGTESGAIR